MAEKRFQVLYDYEDVPTLKKFALSNKRVRMAMGPFGCLSNDTEYLGLTGWKRISDYSDDQIAQYSLETGEIEFAKPDEYIVAPCAQFYHFKGLGVDMMLSEEHRILLRAADGMETSSAREVAFDHWGAPLGDEIPNTFKKADLAQDVFSDEATLRLQVAVIAEGSFHKSKAVDSRYCSMGFVKQRKKERIEFLLNLSGTEFKKTEYENGKTYYYFQAPIKTKKFNGLFWMATNREIKIILNELRQWDFHYSNGNTFQYSTTEKESADFIQYCFATQGIAVNINERNRGGVRKPLYRLNVNPANRKNVLYQSPDAVSLVNYGNGLKYCFKTKTGFFVARRNGKIFITGNSGKSSACVMEIIRRAHEQKAGPDGIRRSRWAVVRNCFDDKTEILTEKRGWQLFKDLLPDDKVASLVNDKELVFVKPLNYYKYPYKGEMIGYSNRNLDFLVTPEHNLYASMINGRTKEMYGYKFHKAEDIYGMTHYKFKTNADEYNGGQTDFSERMFEFFGFWFAEGYVGKYPRKDTSGYHWRFTVTQKDNAEYVAKLLSDCGFKYGKNKGGGSAYNYSIYINDDIKCLIEKLLPCGKSTTKYLPEWIKNAPNGHLKAFLKGYEGGDGHTRLHKNDSTRLYTSSEQLANDLQEIIFKCGGSASLKKVMSKQRVGSFKDRGFRFVLTVHQPNQYHPQTQKKDGWYKEKYNGMVYCVEVPSHVIAIRRCGVISMSCQSYGQLKDTTIKTFHDWFPPLLFGEYRVTDHMYIITKFPGVYLEVLFRALDRPDQVSNLLSLELTGAWFNEVREIPRTIIEAMDGRIGRYPSGRDGGASWYGIIMDTNPPDEDSYLYKMFERVRPDNWEIFKQPSGLSTHAENTKHLPKNYYQNLVKGKDEMYKRIYVDGQYGFLVTGKPVFQSFVDNVHVARKIMEPEKGLDVIVGFDFGLSPACVIGQITPLGQLIIYDELVSDGMGLRQFCENQLLPLLRRKYFGMRVMGFGDPSGTSRAPTDESTCFEILQGPDVGLREILPATTNAILARIGAVESFLNKMYKGEPGFILSPNCHFLRKAFNGGYHYEKIPKSVSGDEYKPMPAKNFSSHISDALQYLCLYIDEKSNNDKLWKSFSSRMKRVPYRPAVNVAGY